MADHDGIGTAAPQVGCGIEGAHARLHGEVLRVDDEARVERRGLDAREHEVIAEVHQELRDELTRRARGRLDVDEQRVLDEVLAAAVVVDDDDAVDALE